MQRLMFTLLVLAAAFGSYWLAGSKVKKPAFFSGDHQNQEMSRLVENMGETELTLASVFRSPQKYPLGWADSLKQLQLSQRQTYANTRKLLVERYEGQRSPGWARFIRNNPLYVSLAVLSLLALIWMPGQKEKRVAAPLGPKKGKKFGGWRQPALKKSGIPVDPEAAPLGEFSEDVSVSHFEVLQSKKPSSLEPMAVLDEDENEEVEEIEPPAYGEVSDEISEEPTPSDQTSFVSENPEIQKEDKNQVRERNEAIDMGETQAKKKQDGWEDDEKRAKWKHFEDEENRKVTVMKLVRRGSTVTEISQRLKISKTEVELMIKDFKSKL